MKSMILAAGFGTRFRPITYTLPKPLVPVCNRALIAYAADNYLRAGIDEIIVNLHHLPEQIERFLTAEYRHRCRFHFSREEEILGTGGGIARVRPLLESEREFYVVNGDTIQMPPYAELSRARRERNAIAALTLRHPPHGDRFTPVWYEDGRVTGFGRGTGEVLMFSGSHAISTAIFRDFPAQEIFGIVEEVYQPLLERREVIAGVVDDGLWFDIGTPQRYQIASRAMRERMLRGAYDLPPGSRAAGSSIVHDTAHVTGGISNSVIGPRSVVEGEIHDTAVWDDCRIGPRARLDGCIIAHGVEIDASVELSNAIICRDDPTIPREDTYRFEHGVVIADL